MEKLMRQHVNDVFQDLQEACAHSGEKLCAEGLADTLQDFMHDNSVEYRALSYDEGRAIALKVAKQYV